MPVSILIVVDFPTCTIRADIGYRFAFLNAQIDVIHRSFINVFLCKQMLHRTGQTGDL